MLAHLKISPQFFGGFLSYLLIPKYSVGDLVIVNSYQVRIDTVKATKDDVYYGVTLIDPIGMIHSISISERMIVDYVERRTSECDSKAV
jgi:hypothetical protein